MRKSVYILLALALMALPACRENTTPIFPDKPTRPTNVPADAYLIARDSFENPTWEWIHLQKIDSCERQIYAISSYSNNGAEMDIQHRCASSFFQGNHTNHISGSAFCFVEPFDLYVIHQADSFCLLFPVFINQELFEVVGQDTLYEVPEIGAYEAGESHWKIPLHVEAVKKIALVPIQGDTFWLKRMERGKPLVDSAMFHYTCTGSHTACWPKVLYADKISGHFIPLCPNCDLDQIGEWFSH
jgi:hypothetical protein